MKIINTFINGINHMRVDLTEYLLHGPTVGRNTESLAQRNASICFNTMCPNTEYMDLNQEKCPTCNKKTAKTIRQENPPYERIK